MAIAKYPLRLTAPLHSDNKYFSNENIYHASGSGVYHKKDGKYGYWGNCCSYAWGRMWELNGKKPSGWSGDPAGMFNSAKSAGFKTGTEPKLGAFAIFKKDGASHIACVEKIAKNGDLTMSQSAWNRIEFEIVTVTKASGYLYAGAWKFIGFVYPLKDYGSGDYQSQIPAKESPVVAPVIKGEAAVTVSSVKAGTKITLNNTLVYTSETGSATGTKTGTFYIWSGEVKNGRIKITNNKANVGKAGQVTCWVAVTIKKTTSTDKKITKGQKFSLKSTPVYNNENGSSIGTRTGTYYAWEAEGTAKRIRMTNATSRVGVAGQVSFFCAVSDLKKL